MPHLIEFLRYVRVVSDRQITFNVRYVKSIQLTSVIIKFLQQLEVVSDRYSTFITRYILSVQLMPYLIEFLQYVRVVSNKLITFIALRIENVADTSSHRIPPRGRSCQREIY